MVDHFMSDVVAFSLDPIYGFRVNEISMVIGNDSRHNFIKNMSTNNFIKNMSTTQIVN